MIVFKTFWKIVNRNKFIIILYTAILIAFAGFNLNTSDNSTNFVASRPDILIVNRDKISIITDNLIDYLSKNCNIKKIGLKEDSISDALFYRNVNYVIYIPENYGEEFLNGNNPKFEIKSTGDYQASLANMMLERYLKVSEIYRKEYSDKTELINKINETLSNDIEVTMESKIDTDSISKAVFYYNFLNYSIIAGLVYIICLIILSFNSEKVKKRTLVSSTSYKKINKQLLLSNMILASVVWAFYVILSLVLIGKIMFTINGLLLILNSFILTICAVTIAFLIANLVKSKNAVNGIINVVGLGSSFLCGVFVPIDFLPDVITKIAKCLPSYWYVQNNEIIKTLEEFNFQSLKEVFINLGILIAFSIVFIIITNLVSRKRK